MRSYRRDWVGFFIAKMKQSKTADTAKQLKTRFLPHDYNARQDPKLIKLQIKHGLEGIGLYWCLVEMTWEQDNALEWDPDLVAYTLRTNAELVKSVAENFGLFKIKANVLSSDAIAKRMAYFDEKSQKAKLAAEMRWQSGRNANAMQTHSERNAIKKEIKKETNKEEKEINIEGFEPPTVDLILDSFPSFKDAKKFVDFYTAKGWRMGAAPMTDWRAAVSLWIERNADRLEQLPTAQRPKLYKKANLD